MEMQVVLRPSRETGRSMNIILGRAGLCSPRVVDEYSASFFAQRVLWTKFRFSTKLFRSFGYNKHVIVSLNSHRSLQPISVLPMYRKIVSCLERTWFRIFTLFQKWLRKSKPTSCTSPKNTLDGLVRVQRGIHDNDQDLSFILVKRYTILFPPSGYLWRLPCVV